MTGGGREGGGNGRAVYLNLNIMQIARDKMNNNCNGRGGEERRFVVDKPSATLQLPERSVAALRTPRRIHFASLQKARKWLDLNEDAGGYSVC